MFDAIWQDARLIDDAPDPANDADARLVAAATAAGVQLFITGDKRVLGWQETQGASGAMRVVSPRQAWDVLFGAAAGH